jgi:hypothetical protein
MANMALERGVVYDPYVKKYLVGGLVHGYEFGCVEFANIFAYLAVEYGATYADEILKKIEKKFKASWVAFDMVTSLGKDVWALVPVVAQLGGDAYMKYQCTQVGFNLYDPQRDTQQYIDFLMISWCYRPDHQPLYKKMPPDVLGTRR